MKNKVNYIFGYGSLINKESRYKTIKNKSVCDDIPVKISKDFGYIREWNYKGRADHHTGNIINYTALGLRKSNNGHSINGVLYPITKNKLHVYDKREKDYLRIKIPHKYITILSNKLSNKSSTKNQPLDTSGYVWVYVLAKGGANYNSNNNIHTATIDYPIRQMYIDICILGCLQYGEEFAIEFINSTYKWSANWINDRVLSTWLRKYKSQYKKIDNLLKTYPKHKTRNKFTYRTKRIKKI